MRTVKNTKNIKLREKGSAGRDGFEISLCSEHRFSEKYVQFKIVVLGEGGEPLRGDNAS